MKSLQQFLSEYFAERTALYETQRKLFAPLHEKFFAPGCSSALFSERGVEKSGSETILDASEADGETLVVTSGMHARAEQWPLRYHLQPSGDTWQIHLVEWECLGCHATGRLNGEVCFVCKGKGWDSNGA